MGDAVVERADAAVRKWWLEAGVGQWLFGMAKCLESQFNVSHAYVLRKLLLLLCPFAKLDRSTLNAAPNLPAHGMEEVSGIDRDGLKTDVTDTDLYVPLMSFATYVVVFALQHALVHGHDTSTTCMAASFSVTLVILEVILTKFSLYLYGSSVDVSDALASTGYKYFNVCLLVLLKIALGTGLLQWLFFAYLAACASITVRRTLLRTHKPLAEWQHLEVTGLPSTLLPSESLSRIVSVAALGQIVGCWLLLP